MPNITKQFHIDITPERFLAACSREELQEVDLLLNTYLSPEFKKAQDQLEKALNENPNICKECGFSYDTMVSKDLCVNCWERIKMLQPKKLQKCYKTGKYCNYDCSGQCRESC